MKKCSESRIFEYFIWYCILLIKEPQDKKVSEQNSNMGDKDWTPETNLERRNEMPIEENFEDLQYFPNFYQLIKSLNSGIWCSKMDWFFFMAYCVNRYRWGMRSATTIQKCFHIVTYSMYQFLVALHITMIPHWHSRISCLSYFLKRKGPLCSVKLTSHWLMIISWF